MHGCFSFFRGGKGVRSVKDKRREKQQQTRSKSKSGSKSAQGAGAAGTVEGGVADAHDDWFTDTSVKAQEERRQEEFSEMKNQDSEVQKDVIDLLQKAKQSAPGQLPPVTVSLSSFSPWRSPMFVSLRSQCELFYFPGFASVFGGEAT